MIILMAVELAGLVDDEVATMEVRLSRFPRASQLCCPPRDKPAFHHQQVPIG
jgi:hypothetical protein